jgi:hypothetical protein
VTRGLHLAAAEATYWSSTPVGVTAADIRAAWAAAAGEVWKDEVHVDEAHQLTRAEFLFNSGHVRMTVCECVLLVAPVLGNTTHFLTAVVGKPSGPELGWALHTRTLDALEPGGWANPSFGEQARRSWTDRESLRRRAQAPQLRFERFEAVHVDRVARFALEVDRESGRTFVSIPVSNAFVEYTEWYEVDSPTFARYAADPALAQELVALARARELDHLLLLEPGSDRGFP